MKLLLASLMLVSSSAFAHFKIGTYKGQNTQGADCTVEFKKKTFVNNVKNPINERVLVLVNGKRPFILTHLPVIDNARMTVSADKSNLTGVKGGNGKAISMQIHMDHTIGGPDSYTILKHDWKNKTHSKKECLDLEFQEN